MTQIAYEHIIQKIDQGKYESGDKIIIEEIAKELGMSRIPVRESIKQLASEGILTIDSHKSPRLRKVSLKDIEQIYEIRKILEPRSVVKALDNLSPADLQHLEKLVAEMGVCIRERKINNYLNKNREFHFYLYKKSKNPWLLKYIESLLYFTRWVDAATYFKDEIIDVTSHEKILKAIKNKNRESLEKLVAEHIDHGYRITRLYLLKLKALR